jgi:dephospho-CoA kinase
MLSEAKKIKIVGIGGLPRSGKDTLAEMFIAQGYFGVSFGDIVRDISRTRHAAKPDPISRANTTETSNWLRQQNGSDFIMKQALKLYETETRLRPHRGLLAWSIRAPIEVDFILSHGGKLIWVEASDQIRFERTMANLRVGETKISLAEFKRQEDEQWVPQPGQPAEIQMSVSYVKAKATDRLLNDGSFDEFKTHAQALIDKINAE